MKIVVSSGHGLFVPGARGLIDEVEEARMVTDRVKTILLIIGVEAVAFHENYARNQRDNVNTIINFHNSQMRDLDVSIHFNSTKTGNIEERAIGVETLYESNSLQTRELAEKVSADISRESGLRNRGSVPRNDIGVLTRTTAPTILIEVCFVVSRADVNLYHRFFEEICQAIAKAITQNTLSGLWPISEENIEAMKYLNVIQSPEYWRGVTDIEWLDQLLTNAATPGKLDRNINNSINDINAAIDVLVDASIISSPEYWRNLILSDASVGYLDRLLINIANRSRH